MKTLGNLDLCGNSITGVNQVIDVNGNPIGGVSLKMYQDSFESVDGNITSETGTDSSGNTVYYQTYTVEGDTHGIAHPMVQIFQYDGVSTYSAVDVDIDVNSSDYSVTFKFVADENGDVAEWLNGTITYAYRILGFGASAAGSDSGNGD